MQTIAQSVWTSPSRFFKFMGLMPPSGRWPKLKGRYVLAFFQKVPPCLRHQACASAHHWLRELQTLGHSERSTPQVHCEALL
jgi:hypothetical protein